MFVPLLGAGLLVATCGVARTAETSQGRYFAKKEYAPQPLPRFADLRDRLPAPIFDDQPEWVRMYWKAWELAFRNFHQPAPGSGFVSPFIDAAFNQNIFQWDTCFLTMFCNVAHPLVPGIGSLDNFYARQHPDGAICREIGRATGADFPEWVNREGRSLFSRWGWNVGPNDPVIYAGREAPQPPPILTLDALNHPILYLLEYAIGLKADARENALTWRLGSPARQGCERFRFNGHVVSLVAEPVAPEGKRFRVTVQSDGAFKLRLIHQGRGKSVSVKAGEQVIPMP